MIKYTVLLNKDFYCNFYSHTFTLAYPFFEYRSLHLFPSMVRIKYRQIAFIVKTDPPELITRDSIKKIIYNLVNDYYGLKITFQMKSFVINDHLESCNLFIVRVLREICKQVCDSLKRCCKIGVLAANIDVIALSGSVRGIRKKVLKKIGGDAYEKAN